MSDDETDAFLESERYGTRTLDGDSPYAIPLSYGYDADERALYMHLATFDGSEKRTRLSDSNAVSLVVSRYVRPDRWRSAVNDDALSRSRLWPSSGTSSSPRRSVGKARRRCNWHEPTRDAATRPSAVRVR